MLDRNTFDNVVGSKLDSMFRYLEKEKSEGNSGALYPWYIPGNRLKHFDGFKNHIFDALKAEGYFVTDFQPGFRPEMGGIMRDIYICFSEDARIEAEQNGMAFK